MWHEVRVTFYQPAKSDDFIGVQACHKVKTEPEICLPKRDSELIDSWDHDASPSALRVVVEEAWRETGVPVIFTENGSMEFDDKLGVKHLDWTMKSLGSRLIHSQNAMAAASATADR